MADANTPQDGAGSIEGAGVDARSQGEVTMRLDNSNSKVFYSNAFRTTTTAEEVTVDLGLNSVEATASGGAEILFRSECRMVLSYYSAKRLAMGLGRIVRSYEESFGEIELDSSKRRDGASGQALG